MAEKLARICFTEEDKVNCPFYFKIGACRYGDKCARLHHKPLESQTVLLAHMYDNPPHGIALASGVKLPEEAIKEVVRHFEEFYEEVFLELAVYGEIEEMHISDNIGDHMIGNVYVKYYLEDDAAKALNALKGRYYAGKLIVPEYSPVTNFREARCRQYDEGTCSRGGYCNFMHLKYVSKSFRRSLFRQMYDEHPEYREKRKEREKHGSKSRSRSGSRDRGRDRDREREREKDRDKDRDRKKRRSRSDSQSRRSRRKRSRSRDKDRDRKHRQRSRSRSKDDHRSKDKGKASGGRTESEERRAMIEQWNQEAGQ